MTTTTTTTGQIPDEILRRHKTYGPQGGPADWSRTSFGGWVHRTATVHPRAMIGVGASVGPYARIGEGAQIEREATVRRDARIEDHARVGPGASLGPGCSIGRWAVICRDARLDESVAVGRHANVGAWSRLGVESEVGRYAVIGDGAQLGPDATVGDYGYIEDGARFAESPLMIQGTEHPIRHIGPGMLRIGCCTYPIAEWLEDHEAIGEDNGYPAARIAEYREYIELAARRDAAIFPDGVLPEIDWGD